MLTERVEKLCQEYTGQYVVVDDSRAELQRFAGHKGRVKTINFNGRALVQFEGPDPGWYDLELDFLKVLDNLEPEAEEAKPEAEVVEPTPASPPTAPAEPEPTETLSRLELARLEKEAADRAAEQRETNP